MLTAAGVSADSPGLLRTAYRRQRSPRVRFRVLILFCLSAAIGGYYGAFGPGNGFSIFSKKAPKVAQADNPSPLLHLPADAARDTRAGQPTEQRNSEAIPVTPPAPNSGVPLALIADSARQQGRAEVARSSPAVGGPSSPSPRRATASEGPAQLTKPGKPAAQSNPEPVLASASVVSPGSAAISPLPRVEELSERATAGESNIRLISPLAPTAMVGTASGNGSAPKPQNTKVAAKATSANSADERIGGTDAGGSSQPSTARDESNVTPAGAKPGIVFLMIRPWGEVYVDGIRVGVSPPLKELKVAPGKRLIVVRNTALPPYEQTLEVRPEARTTLIHRFE
jgi:hypothetical protein